MKSRYSPYWLLLTISLILILLNACAPASTTQEVAIIETVAPAVEKTVEVIKEGVVEVTAVVKETQAAPVITKENVGKTPTVKEEPALQPSKTTVPTPESFEERTAELEWPPKLRFGESDTVRLSLIPTQEGYILKSEYPENKVEGEELIIPRPGGYELWAAAQLDGVGFDIAPRGLQEQWAPVDQPVTWRWSITAHQPGRQRLAMNLWLRWKPIEGIEGKEKEYIAFSRTMNVVVSSILGLKRSQALSFAVVGLFFGGLLSLTAVITLPTQPRRWLNAQKPNPGLQIELSEKISLDEPERLLFSALFHRYSRLAVEKEFLSGYSGARTFLALPIRPDGRSDAYTIAKIGEANSINREFNNYETYVKDTLPPVTARIQHSPVIVAASTKTRNEKPVQELAGLQYTFIGERGSLPISLRQALINDPRPELLEILFNTFGPGWWMQRRPYTFRTALEFDCLLPSHLVLEPTTGRGHDLTGGISPRNLQVEIGETITLHGFRIAERKFTSHTISLEGQQIPGEPPLRIRWSGMETPHEFTGRVIENRQSLLRKLAQNLNLFSLTDPLPRIPGLLEETLVSTQSTIHGDLNLENVLLGPGDLVWLIDFAQTRDAPPLLDFAHLEADFVAHVLAVQIQSTEDYLLFIQGNPPSSFVALYSVYEVLQNIALRCLANPSQPREWHLARFFALIGALKYANIDDHARHCLYLTAAQIPL